MNSVQRTSRLCAASLLALGLTACVTQGSTPSSQRPAQTAPAASQPSAPVGTRASAAGQTKLPAEVAARLNELRQTCRESGGQVKPAAAFLSRADLDGDGQDDYLIDTEHLNCSVDLWGSGGTSLTVFVARGAAQVLPPFEQINVGVRIDRSLKPAKVQVLVGGPLCGQRTGQLSRAEYAKCWRPVVWDARGAQVKLAPISQIQWVR